MTHDRTRLLHTTTVPISFTFLHGPVDFVIARGVKVHALSSPGPELGAFGQRHDIPTYAVEMPRRIIPPRLVGWSRRKQAAAFVKVHPRRRLFWFALFITGVYVTALGMAVGNVGITARQRVHILPFVFMFFAGVAGARGVPNPRGVANSHGVPYGVPSGVRRRTRQT